MNVHTLFPLLTLQKTAPTQIGHDHYTYDSNGNPMLVTNDSTNTTREMYWDEDNRLMVLSDNVRQVVTLTMLPVSVS